MSVITAASIVDAIAIADIEAGLGAVAPDGALHEPRKHRGKGGIEGRGIEGANEYSETTALCRELSGREVPIGSEPDTRAGDVRCYLSDCTALFAHTDWRPQRTPREVLHDIHAWISDHEQLVLAAL